MKLQATNTPSVTTIAVKLSPAQQERWELLCQTTGLKSSALLAAIASEVHNVEHEAFLRELFSRERDDSNDKTVVTSVESSFAENINNKLQSLGGHGRSRGKALVALVERAFEEYGV